MLIRWSCEVGCWRRSAKHTSFNRKHVLSCHIAILKSLVTINAVTQKSVYFLHRDAVSLKSQCKPAYMNYMATLAQCVISAQLIQLNIFPRRSTQMWACVHNCLNPNYHNYMYEAQSRFNCTTSSVNGRENTGYLFNSLFCCCFLNG